MKYQMHETEPKKCQKHWKISGDLKWGSEIFNELQIKSSMILRIRFIFYYVRDSRIVLCLIRFSHLQIKYGPPTPTPKPPEQVHFNVDEWGNDTFKKHVWVSGGKE